MVAPIITAAWIQASIQKEVLHAIGLTRGAGLLGPIARGGIAFPKPWLLYPIFHSLGCTAYTPMY